MLKKQKLYLVKREVIATSIQKAMTNKGTIYSIEVTEEKSWPEQKKKEKLGFENKKKK